MRIKNHPILGADSHPDINILFEGNKITAKKGETVAAALMANGIRQLGRSRKMNQTRGVFCANGRCCSCFMTIDGSEHMLACQTLVAEGMEVLRDTGDPDVRRNQDEI
jgi:sarcosine oxidase, subunit alpha